MPESSASSVQYTIDPESETNLRALDVVSRSDGHGD